MDVAGRAARLRARFDGAGCDGLVVTNLRNVRYLTGFSGSAAAAVVTAAEMVLVTDGRYREQAEADLAGAGVERMVRLEIALDRHAQRAAVVAAAAGAGRIGLEAASVTWAAQMAYAREWFPGAEVVATDGLVEELRRTKDAGEQARIAEAARIADAALAGAVAVLVSRPMTEAELALALEAEIRGLGSPGSSFETIVGSGPNGARPHARAGPRPIGRGELVVVDFGAMVDGYRSDMTRTLCLGPPAPAELARVVEVVAAAQA
ncbi:MAG: M24 family metallopeptidase, partial [Acidimicrobiales bacterium]